MGIISSLFGAGRKIGVIDKAIEHLGIQGSIIGTAYKEISYSDVIHYIKAKNCKVIRTTKKPGGDWIEFTVDVQETNYTVYLDKTFEGDGSVLTAKKTNKSA